MGYLGWPSFSEILQGLHREGIYISAHQLAAFLVTHRLPVDLCYVPDHLRAKAAWINAHYQGDMARLTGLNLPPWEENGSFGEWP